MIFRDILAALFGRLRAVKGQSPHDGCNAAHNQHSETRRPSHRDRIVTTGHSRFRPARPDTEFVVCNFEEDHWRGRDAYAFFRNLQKARRNRGKTECQACSRQRADQRKRGVSVARSAGTVISPVRSIDP